MKGTNKLLLEIGQVPIIRRVVQAALESMVDEVVVVVGWQAEQVRHALHGLSCRVVVNPNYEKGQSESVKVGLSEINPTARAVLILPGDVAMIDSHSINAVIETYEKERCGIAVACHHERFGHPILFDKRLFPEIQRINEETFGLKAVVSEHQGEVCKVETSSLFVLREVDTPEALKRLSGS